MKKLRMVSEVLAPMLICGVSVQRNRHYCYEEHQKTMISGGI